MWNKSIKIRENAVVFKQYDAEGGHFVKSCVIPSELYPLNNKKNNPVKTFHSGNTVEIADEKVKEIIDKVTYRVGGCYQNSFEMLKLLHEDGIDDVKAYAGWACISNTQLPIHHSWLVLNGNSIIDLADEVDAILEIERNKDNLTGEEVIERMLAYRKGVMDKKNTERIPHIGKCSKGMYYIGCECEPYDALKMYQSLIQRYPNHEAQRNVNSVTGRNRTQQAMFEAGLI